MVSYQCSSYSCGNGELAYDDIILSPLCGDGVEEAVQVKFEPTATYFPASSDCYYPPVLPSTHPSQPYMCPSANGMSAMYETLPSSISTDESFVSSTTTPQYSPRDNCAASASLVPRQPVTTGGWRYSCYFGELSWYST